VSDPRSPFGLASWRQRLPLIWLRRGAWARALWPVSQLYGWVWWLRERLYRWGILPSHRLPVPVVVVGNVVVGGAGKTPTVVQIVRHLQARGWRPGVVSRGHGREGDAPCLVTPERLPQEVGDEPCLLAQATGVPVVVARRRVAAAEALLAWHPEVDVVVSDDGMQHWALQRDVTVVLFDRRGTGNGWLLPAGLLRQPWPARAWGGGPLLVLQTGQAPLPDSPWPVFTATRRLSAVAHNAWGQPCALADLTTQAPSRRWGALAGIAQPEAFFEMLREQGLDIAQALPLPDHADAQSLRLAIAAAPAADAWLCTEKDAVKLFALLRHSATACPPVWAVPLEQSLATGFWTALDAALPRAPVQRQALSSPHGHQTP
jgi:tetraacyldisaccharide 4'-kinase